MKCAMLVALLLTTMTALAAEDKPAQEPAALVKLRKAYEAKVKAAVDPITAAYLKKLDEMKKEFGAKGDLESAQAVQKEIEAMTAEKPTTKATAKRKAPITIVGKWTWAEGLTAEFREDGTCSHSNGSTGKWVCLDRRTRKYQGTMTSGHITWIQLSSDGNSFVARTNAKQNWTSERMLESEKK